MNTRATEALWAREHHSLVCILNASLWVLYRYWTKERQGEELRAETVQPSREERLVAGTRWGQWRWSRDQIPDVIWIWNHHGLLMWAEKEKSRIMPCFVCMLLYIYIFFTHIVLVWNNSSLLLHLFQSLIPAAQRQPLQISEVFLLVFTAVFLNTTLIVLDFF